MNASEEMKSWVRHYMNKVADKLGFEHANSVLMNMAISKDPNEVFHLANPTLKRR